MGSFDVERKKFGHLKKKQKKLAMPYSGRQAAACYAKANACLQVGRSPTWACRDEWKEIYPIKSPEQVWITSGGYRTRCGPLLSSSIREDKTFVDHPYRRAIQDDETALGLEDQDEMDD